MPNIYIKVLSPKYVLKLLKFSKEKSTTQFTKEQTI